MDMQPTTLVGLCILICAPIALYFYGQRIGRGERDVQHEIERDLLNGKVSRHERLVSEQQHIAARQIPRLTGNLGGQVQVQQKILPQRFLRLQIMGGNYIPQGRQVINHRAASPLSFHKYPRRRQRIYFASARIRAIRSAIFSASITLSGLAIPCPAISNAVP